jgi:hypothetical protein
VPHWLPERWSSCGEELLALPCASGLTMSFVLAAVLLPCTISQAIRLQFQKVPPPRVERLGGGCVPAVNR